MTALRSEELPPGEQMPGTQGLRPFDPYRTLQLHPDAPRDLIEGAYWLLVSTRSQALSEARIEELNVAYAALLDAEARRAYVEEHVMHGPAVPAVRARGPLVRLFSAKTPSVDIDHIRDYYHVLRIDSEADSRIIQLAYVFWMQGLHGARVERGRIEEAHRTLANPLLRAQYDARRDEAAAHEKGRFTKEEHRQIQTARHNGVPKTGVSARASAIADRQPAASDPPPSPAQRVPQVPRSANGDRFEPAAPKPKPAEPETAAAARVEPAAPKLKAVEPEPVAAASVEASPAPRQSDVLAHPWALATKQLNGRQLAEAQQNRLLQLREEPVAVAVPAPSAPLPKPAPRSAATLAFISGPRTGERMDLAEESVKLGSDYACQIVLQDASIDIEREHAQLSPHGASYVFRDLAGHDTTIADQPLSVPVVILEDGDEIQIGVHRLRFTQTVETTAPVSVAREAV
jgi:Inner membrane component of T3SS, cytoplasmic domain